MGKFRLSEESRLPKWFVHLSDRERRDISVTIDYYLGLGLGAKQRSAVITLWDNRE
jgi:hypothetical protein